MFANYRALALGPLKQRSVLSRIYDIQPVSQNGDGAASSIQSCPVSDAVNAPGQATDDGDAVLR